MHTLGFITTCHTSNSFTTEGDRSRPGGLEYVRAQSIPSFPQIAFSQGMGAIACSFWTAEPYKNRMIAIATTMCVMIFCNYCKVNRSSINGWIRKFQKKKLYLWVKIAHGGEIRRLKSWWHEIDTSIKPV